MTTEIKEGQIWRDEHGNHIRTDIQSGEQVFVFPCDAAGNVGRSGPQLMNLCDWPTPSWTFVGYW